MKEIGFGIVGCGMIAEFHAKALAGVKGARLVGVMSRSEDKAKKTGAQFGVPCFTDLKKLLAAPGLDAVCITTPSGSHLEPVVEAAVAGKHIVCEKPLEITLDRIDKLVAACDKNKVKLGAIFQARFGEGAQTARKAVQAGRLGKMALCDCYVKWWRTQAYYDSGGWRGTWKLDGGGALMNQSIHAIDLLQWLVGKPSEITGFTATLAHERIEVEDTATAALKYANGALGVIQGATSVFPGFLKRVELSGDKGSIILEDDRITCWKFEKEMPEDEAIRQKYAQAGAIGGGASDPRAISTEGHRMQLQDMVDAINGSREPRVPGREGRNAVEIILAIYKSAKEGKAVKLPLK
ncbi:MAG: Gfo/Idh/MocA family oxidoreductase [Verrucomicrobiae bacterium]|nr:Gfo/Idh/MocA family oxidoreductase [Verrucomicrobiae bacterium]